ncbi:GatB/YqeY domain-containing protein [Spectribacter hydrogenoxidans]|uniref:GatB/YqeY domain-containing protein n=1 Tax=Spectribacter hydrogenoxidans TaxID=3075608 RepID=A0ABU3BZJ0_9GAMM|nr:GatB/YqeY domain-containing protein [Salinisphaera sp. W335]MDT0634719.1 GatB/YqeY domain-containing protein [Salinisphaera sp. W335]
MTLKEQLSDDMKSALRAKDRERLAVLRMLLSAVRQREIDERIELDDAGVLALIDKMVKQRRDAETQYRDAGRGELADAEAAEVVVLETYLPDALSDQELADMVAAAVTQSGAQSMQDMGKVMGILKPQVQGRADMGAVSAAVKNRLG